jgi:hypothetical protein
MREVHVSSFDDYLEMMEKDLREIFGGVVFRDELEDTIKAMMHYNAQTMASAILSINASLDKFNGDYKQCVDSALQMCKYAEEVTWHEIAKRQEQEFVNRIVKKYAGKKIKPEA